MRLHLDGVRNVGQLGGAQQLGGLAFADFDVIGGVAFAALGGFQHQRHFARLGRQFQHIAFLDVIGGDGDAAAVHLHMAVADDLAGGKRGRHELGAVHDRVQAGFQQADHVLAGVAGAAGRIGVILAELALGDVAVIALQFLLGLQLGAIVAQLLGAALAVLARTIGPLVDRALGTAPEIFANAAVQLVLRILALAHQASFVNFADRVTGKARTYTDGFGAVKPVQPPV